MATVEPVFAFHKTGAHAETENSNAEKILCKIVTYPSIFTLIKVQIMSQPRTVLQAIPLTDLPGLKRRRRLFVGSWTRLLYP
jgi:hypothetical protein